VAVLGIVVLYKLVEVRALEGIRLECEVHGRAEVVDPELLCPGCFACRLFVEEQHVGFHALGVEQARGQPQERMHVALLQELSPDRLPCPAFEQDVQ